MHISTFIFIQTISWAQFYINSPRVQAATIKRARHVCHQGTRDSSACWEKVDLMHFAPMEMRTVGVSWRQIKAANRSNPEPFPLAVPPTIQSPFLSMCGKGCMRPSSDSHTESLSPKQKGKMEGFWIQKERPYSTTNAADYFCLHYIGRFSPDGAHFWLLWLSFNELGKLCGKDAISLY